MKLATKEALLSLIGYKLVGLLFLTPPISLTSSYRRMNSVMKSDILKSWREFTYKTCHKDIKLLELEEKDRRENVSLTHIELQ